MSSQGWVEHDGILVVDTATAETQTVALGDADYVSVYAGQQDRFAVLHHFRDGSKVRVSVHGFEDPASPRAALTVSGLAEVGSDAFVGDAQEWQLVRHGYIAYYGTALQSPEYSMILIDPIRLTASVQRFGWYDDRFDKGYQAPTEAVAVPYSYYGAVDPGVSLYAVAVGRDSKLYLYAPENDRLYGEVPLAGRRGGHPPIFRERAPEAWLTDYDVLIRMDPRSWTVRNQESLQESVEGVGMFIGEIAINADESLCIVPRPGRGDVLAVDTSTFAVVGHAPLGRQPLEAVALSDGRVFARDWKTGGLLSGRLKPR